jgi:hypothetical protein
MGKVKLFIGMNDRLKVCKASVLKGGDRLPPFWMISYT